MGGKKVAWERGQRNPEREQWILCVSKNTAFPTGKGGGCFWGNTAKSIPPINEVQSMHTINGFHLLGLQPAVKWQ